MLGYAQARLFDFGHEFVRKAGQVRFEPPIPPEMGIAEYRLANGKTIQT